MNSQFVDDDVDELKPLAGRIRTWVDMLQPLYVSDHVGLHKFNNQQLPETVEMGHWPSTTPASSGLRASSPSAGTGPIVPGGRRSRSRTPMRQRPLLYRHYLDPAKVGALRC